MLLWQPLCVDPPEGMATQGHGVRLPWREGGRCAIRQRSSKGLVPPVSNVAHTPHARRIRGRYASPSCRCGLGSIASPRRGRYAMPERRRRIHS